jgi:hypothetical protein
MLRVMGAAAGSSPVSALHLVLLYCLVLFLGFSKIRFAMVAAAPHGAEKDKGDTMATRNSLATFASAFFDTLHGLGVAALVASAVP